MREYTNIITLSQNSRGVWDLDPFKWCPYWLKLNKNWCYGNCYAAKIARLRWFDFWKLVKRDFKDEKHLQSIWKKLSKIPFVRLWVSCDPSSDWDHTISIIKKIKPYIKNIIIITKHWNILTDKQCKELEWLCINTSISALIHLNR